MKEIKNNSYSIKLLPIVILIILLYGVLAGMLNYIVLFNLGFSLYSLIIVVVFEFTLLSIILRQIHSKHSALFWIFGVLSGFIAVILPFILEYIQSTECIESWSCSVKGYSTFLDELANLEVIEVKSRSSSGTNADNFWIWYYLTSIMSGLIGGVILWITSSVPIDVTSGSWYKTKLLRGLAYRLPKNEWQKFNNKELSANELLQSGKVTINGTDLLKLKHVDLYIAWNADEVVLFDILTHKAYQLDRDWSSAIKMLV